MNTIKYVLFISLVILLNLLYIGSVFADCNIEHKIKQLGEIYEKLGTKNRRVMLTFSKTQKCALLNISNHKHRKLYISLSEQREVFLSLGEEQREVFLSLGKKQRKIYTQYLADKENYFADKSNLLVFANNQKPNQSQWREKYPYHKKNTPQNAWQRVNFYASQHLQKYLSLADKPLPNLVAKPKLPKAQTIKQEPWESNKVFQKKVEKITAERENEIKKLQNNYRKSVERYNNKITELQPLANFRKSKLNEIKPIIISDAFVEVFESFSLSEPNLNQTVGDLGELYLKLASKGANYNSKILVKEPPTELVKQFYTKPEKMRWKLIYEISLPSDKDYQIKPVGLTWQAEELLAEQTDKAAIQQTGGLVAKIGDSDKIQQLKLANPNLVAKSSDLLIEYKDGSTNKISFDDDLEPQIASLKTAKQKNDTWLFVIGAEKYQETDNINFATRSAELFTKLMQKKYGISNNRTIKLINEKATTGAIKGKLQQLVETVTAGESIIFYYNGHGVPVPEKNNAAYILPTDTIPDFVGQDEDLKLTTIYQKLDNSKADKVIVVMDSCFTGLTDGKSIYKGDKGATRLVPKSFDYQSLKKTTILTAGTDRQFASAYKEKGHRLFTYFVMKSLLADKDRTDILHSQVEADVKNVVRNKGLGAKQDPQLLGGIIQQSF